MAGGCFRTEVKKDGSFEISNVLPGSYFVWLMNHDEHCPRAMQAAQEIEVKDTDLENLRLTPVATSEVRGQLRMENGQKVDWGGRRLLLHPATTLPTFGGEFGGERETTDSPSEAGRLIRYENCPAGNYRVMVYSSLAALRDCFVKSINAGGKDVADTGFTVSGGLWSLDIVVSSKGATVEGARC